MKSILRLKSVYLYALTISLALLMIGSIAFAATPQDDALKKAAIWKNVQDMDQEDTLMAFLRDTVPRVQKADFYLGVDRLTKTDGLTIISVARALTTITFLALNADATKAVTKDDIYVTHDTLKADLLQQGLFVEITNDVEAFGHQTAIMANEDIRAGPEPVYATGTLIFADDDMVAKVTSDTGAGARQRNEVIKTC
jgi:hypothetical protein